MTVEEIGTTAIIIQKMLSESSTEFVLKVGSNSHLINIDALGASHKIKFMFDTLIISSKCGKVQFCPKILGPILQTGTANVFDIIFDFTELVLMLKQELK